MNFELSGFTRICLRPEAYRETLCTPTLATLKLKKKRERRYRTECRWDGQVGKSILQVTEFGKSPVIEMLLNLKPQQESPVGVHRSTERGRYLAPPTRGIFVKDLTKKAQFSLYSPPSLTTFSVRPCWWWEVFVSWRTTAWSLLANLAEVHELLQFVLNRLVGGGVQPKQHQHHQFSSVFCDTNMARETSRRVQFRDGEVRNGWSVASGQL